MKIDVTGIILQIINFAIVVVALRFLLLGPITKILTERSRKIAEGQKAAEAALAHESESSKFKEKAVKDARAEAKALLDEARKEAAEKKAELIKQAKQEAQEEKEKILKSAAQERQAQLDGLKDQFEKGVLTVAQAVISEELDAKKHNKLFEKALKEISAA